MFGIEMHKPSTEFRDCWLAAGRHLSTQMQDPAITWLKADLSPPFLEHLSFRLGNQLFFIRLEDADGVLEVPGTRRGLEAIANGCEGSACLMPMRRSAAGWSPELAGWGLKDLSRGEPVDPASLVSDHPIEMTDWELQDFAVQIVRDHLKREEHMIMSSNGDPNVDPSLWFVGSQGPEWVVVRACRYPNKAAARPNNWSSIADRCSALSKKGHFASVSVASGDQDFDKGAKIRPILRGHGMHVSFKGLEA